MHPRSLLTQKSRTLFFSFCICAVFSFTTSYAQITDSAQTIKPHRNELGVDITGFIKLIAGIGNTLDNYTPNYYLTYRHYFKKSNLRMGLGVFGTYSDESIPAGNGTYNYRQVHRAFSVDFRIGYEWYTNLGKRWQIYYGLDLRPSFLYERIEGSGAGGSTEIQDFYAQIYGIAPVLGARFKITERFTIIAESNIALNVEFAQANAYTHYGNGIPDQGNGFYRRTQLYTNYYMPVSMAFTYAL